MISLGRTRRGGYRRSSRADSWRTVSIGRGLEASTFEFHRFPARVPFRPQRLELRVRAMENDAKRVRWPQPGEGNGAGPNQGYAGKTDRSSGSRRSERASIARGDDLDPSGGEAGDRLDPGSTTCTPGRFTSRFAEPPRRNWLACHRERARRSRRQATSPRDFARPRASCPEPGTPSSACVENRAGPGATAPLAPVAPSGRNRR